MPAWSDVSGSRIEDKFDMMLGRLSHELGSHRRAAEKWYEKNRLLENTIRRVIVVGERVDMDALYKLRQRVPNKPRKKWGWRR